jgi:Uncharacterized protein conserved in bacteria (DUF2252)
MGAADLATTPTSGLRVQLCGGAHLSNFGAFASPERRLVFDVNDFDETLPGPFEWDVKRLAVSLAVAGRDNGFGGRQGPHAATSMIPCQPGAQQRGGDGQRHLRRNMAPYWLLDSPYSLVEVKIVLAAGNVTSTMPCTSPAALTTVRSVFEAICHPLLFVPADGDAAG